MSCGKTQLARDLQIGVNQVHVIDLYVSVIRLSVQEVKKRCRAMSGLGLAVPPLRPNWPDDIRLFHPYPQSD